MNIEELNKFVDEESVCRNITQEELLMDLAIRAGIDNFQPHKANDFQLAAIIEIINNI